MADISVEFEIVCSICGTTLGAEAQGPTQRNFYRLQVVAEPCPACIEKAKNMGDNEGYQRGLDDGHAKG